MCKQQHAESIDMYIHFQWLKYYENFYANISTNQVIVLWSCQSLMIKCQIWTNIFCQEVYCTRHLFNHTSRLFGWNLKQLAFKNKNTSFSHIFLFFLFLSLPGFVTCHTSSIYMTYNTLSITASQIITIKALYSESLSIQRNNDPKLMHLC